MADSVYPVRTRALEKEILNQICETYANNWVGLRYHYPKGKDEFLNQCRVQTQNNNFVSALWGIRSLIQDGHADFELMIDPQTSSFIHPLLFQYDPILQEVRVAASFDASLTTFIGKKVTALNGVPVMVRLQQRAKLEPQSTQNSSLEIAARTITQTQSSKPYPDFENSIEVTFEDGSKMIMQARETKTLRKTNRSILNRKGYPSIWGDVTFQQDPSLCRSDNELAKVIDSDEKKWLWWHPEKLSFDFENSLDTFRCWEKNICHVDGVILDLRDTAGGDVEPMLITSYALGGPTLYPAQRLFTGGLITLGNISGRTLRGLKPATIPGFYYLEEEAVVPEEAKKLFRWEGPLIVITNGLCGSACDMLAEVLTQRANTCSYGTPTAGRWIGSEYLHQFFPFVNIDVPMHEWLTKNGERREGIPIDPKYLGNGSVNEALKMCGKP